jgi:hypothetical protein
VSAPGRAGIVAAVLLLSTAVAAQDPLPFLELTAIKAVPKGKGWEIEFSGTAPRLPDGTIIEFSIIWRTQPLRTFDHKLDATGRFHEKRHLEDLVGFAPEVYLKAKIDYVRQPRSVQEAMEKDPATFPIERGPWSVRFWGHRFALGTEAQVAAQEESVRTFFRESLKRALAIEKTFRGARAGAKDGSRFQKAGAFDSGAWQKTVETEVRDPLRELQRELAAEKGTLRILPHQRDFGYLNGIVNAIARRSYERSRSLYDELGLSPDPADLSPREIDIDCQQSSSSYLEETTKRLCESQKIQLSEVSG